MTATTTPAVHPYYLAHAQVILGARGGNADKLAAWAETQQALDTPAHGVIVDIDGAILATTFRSGGPASAVYVSGRIVRDYDIVRNVLDFALLTIARKHGKQVQHVALSRFTGPSPTRGSDPQATRPGG